MSKEALVTLSTNSWHFKLQSFVYGSHAASPERMFNLCPYFWMVIAALILLLPVLPFKLLGYLFDAVDKHFLFPAVERFEEALSDEQAVTLYMENEWYSDVYDRSVRTRLGSKRYYDESSSYGLRQKLLNVWAKKKFGAGSHASRESYNFLREESTKAWNEYDKRRTQKRVKAEERKQLRKDMFSFLDDWMGSLVATLDAIGNYILSMNVIVKWTKRLVGLVMTCLLAVATFFIVGYTGRAVVWIIGVWNWPLFWEMMFNFGVVLAIIASGLALFAGAQWIYKQYDDHDRKLWVVEFFIYTLYWPLRIVFYTVLWRFVCVFLIAGIAKLTWAFIVGIIKTFGKYFAPAYGDYCPGIEWKDA